MGCGLEEARQYAARGWPVVPGTVWNGTGHVVPGTDRLGHGPVPLFRGDRGTTNVDMVPRLWQVDPAAAPSVMVRTGEAFNVVMVPREVAERVIGSGEAPVLAWPRGERGFLTSVGSLEDYGFTGVALAAAYVREFAGETLAMPPSLLGGGLPVEWLISPGDVGWDPMPLDTFALRLAAAL